MPLWNVLTNWFKGKQMVYYNNNELKDLIAAKLTVDQIMDILGWEMADLVEALSDEIEIYQDEFEEAVA